MPLVVTERRPSDEKFFFSAGTIVPVEVMDDTATHLFRELESGMVFSVPDESYYEYVD